MADARAIGGRKRKIQKQFQTWSKTLLYVVGLEQIAKELMGRRRWQHYQQLLMENVHLKDEGKQMEEKDWESSDKCNFCDENSNTSQQKVDNTVPKSQEQSKTQNHSSESSYESEDSEDDATERARNLNFQRSPFNLSNIPDSFYFTKNQLNSMSSIESGASSLAASMATIAAINNISLQKPFGGLRFSPNAALVDMVPQWCLPTANFKLDASKREDSETDVVDEQPLDLSAKSCSPINSPTRSPVDVPCSPAAGNTPNFTSTTSSAAQTAAKVSVLNTNRHIFKAKPRLSPMAGRRTYTEEELQAALRDIQSGKLGTRRAAVIYGIPRSTLRNKVYKLAMEKERDTATFQSLAMEDKPIEEMDVPSDDKEESEEREDEDEDVEKELSATEEDKDADKQFMKPLTVEDLIRFSKQTASPLIENDSLRALLQHGSKFLVEQNLKQEKDSTGQSQVPPPMYSIFPPGAAEIWGNLDPASIAPYFTHLLNMTRGDFNISPLLGHANPYFSVRNQTPPSDSPTEVSPSFSPKFSSPLFPELVQRMLAESEEQRKKSMKNSVKTSESAASFSSPQNDSNQDDSNNSPSNMLNRLQLFKPPYKNGSTSESSFSNIPDFNTDNRVSEAGSEKSVTSSPPPMSAARSDSSSPLPINPKLGLNLRDVIAKSMGHRFQQPHEVPIPHIPGTSNIDSLHRVTFPTLSSTSVIKSHGGEDDKKPCNQVKVPLPSSASNAGSASSGKGTRPKRGKYRNYDRDSLVEAVRAVQRGEMSVHRAGSYYGVPHSTLEYKVKERHLMRPRKREPKNQPDDLKRREDGSVLRLSVNEKPAQHSPSPQPKIGVKPPFTPPSPLPTTPNGMKIPPMFESPHPFAPTNPFQLWSTPFHHLMDYSRNPGFPFMQRMHEESAKTHSLTALGKSAREVAENLYDGSGFNGTFLDGVIRSSLDNDQTFNEQIQRKNILEQLYRNKYQNSMAQHSAESDDESSRPNINHILAHTLLSTVTAKDVKDAAKSTDDDVNNDDKAERSSSDEEKNPNVKDEPNNSVQNQSFNVESHVAGVDMKTEKN